MNLYEIYDAAIENAEINEVEVNVAYLVEYAENVLELYLPNACAELLMNAYRAWSEAEERNSHEHYVLVRGALEEIEID